MNRSISFVLWFVCFAVQFTPATVEGQSVAESAATEVSLCDVLKEPAHYAGKTLMMTVRITSTKEGASLWSPGCSKLGVSLHVDRKHQSESGIVELYREMDKYGLSDHPIIATLTGIYDVEYFDPIRHRKRIVFRAETARDIKRSTKPEFR